MRVINLKKTNQDEVLRTALQVLKQGGLVIYPTETCYGLGVDAENGLAVERLLAYKTRREGKAFSIVVCDQKMAGQYVEINSTAENLYANFLPGPLTVVSKSRGKVAKGIESEDKTVGIRIPDYPPVVELIRQFGKAITTTSANVSYAKRPYSLAEWQKYTPLKNQNLVDLFIDAGKLPANPPSTVVDTTLEDYTVLRQGKIKLKKNGQKTKLTQSAKETEKVGEKLIEKYQKRLENTCLIFLLQGELGSGKTQVAKGIARALGITQSVVSPTFIIIREYSFVAQKTPGTFFHIDTWRLFNPRELQELGIEKMVRLGNVIAIEWADKAAGLLDSVLHSDKVTVVSLNIEVLAENQRRIGIS